ncbi:hypothetical protein ABK040_009254 [Willaertia magna]
MLKRTLPLLTKQQGNGINSLKSIFHLKSPLINHRFYSTNKLNNETNQQQPQQTTTSSNEQTTTNKIPKGALSTIFQSPFLKDDSNKDTYYGTIRELIGIKLKDVPTSIIIFSTLLSAPLLFGTTAFYFSSIPAHIILNYQLNYSAILLTLFSSIHTGLEIGDYLNVKKFINYLNRNNNFNPSLNNKQSTVNNNTTIKEEKVEDLIKEGKKAHTTARIMITLIPTCLAFTTLTLPFIQSTLLLCFGYLFLAFYDGLLTSRGLTPFWFTSFKIPVTIAIVSCIIFSLFFYLIYGAMEQFEKDIEKEKEKVEKLRKFGQREPIDFIGLAKTKQSDLMSAREKVMKEEAALEEEIEKEIRQK